MSDGSKVFKKLHSCKDLFSVTHRNSHHFVSHTAAKAHLHTANESSLDDAVNILVVASLLPDDTVKEIFIFNAHAFRLISVRFSLKVAIVRVKQRSFLADNAPEMLQHSQVERLQTIP